MSESEPLDLTPTPPTARGTSRRKTVAIAGILVLAIGVLLGQGMLSSLNYYMTVDEVYHDRASVGVREVRLEGVVQEGSVVRTSKGANFVIEGVSGRTVTVRAVGEPPQLFRATIPVVVIGSFSSSSNYVFSATQIMVKHSAEYKAQHPDRVTASDGSVR
ncbi:MAG: cytochrome c maturation protein CcmE [Acidobacteria bacterium]|nr:cytochrome c maturation protein CcmE [Acidobacteriota bacterium]